MGFPVLVGIVLATRTRARTVLDLYFRHRLFGQYKRISSYFEGTELACSGLPHGEELKILEPLRDQVPGEVFTTPYANPVAGTPEKVRANLREGMRLLREAGYEVRDYKQVNSRTGEALSVEMLSLTSDPSGAERVIHFYKPSLAAASEHQGVSLMGLGKRGRLPVDQPTITG